MFNCTFSGNTSSSGSAIRSYDSTGRHVGGANCIFWNCPTPPIMSTYSGIGSRPLLTYSDIQFGYTEQGNIDTDPLFANSSAGDFHLLVNSPCANTGTSNGAPLVDLDGTLRPIGSGFDMGAFEYINRCENWSSPFSLADWMYYNEAASSYQAPASGVFESTPDGIRFYGSGYRKAGQVHLAIPREIGEGMTFRAKWLAHPGNNVKYMGLDARMSPQLQPSSVCDFGNLTTDHTWNGSCVVSDDTWYYTRVAFGINSYISYTASGNYDDAGGNVVQTYPQPYQPGAYYLGDKCHDIVY